MPDFAVASSGEEDALIPEAASGWRWQDERSAAWESRAVQLAAEVDWEAALPVRARTQAWHRGQRVKRLLDIVIAFTALVFLLPFAAVVAVAIALDSRGPVFYRWRVIGYRGRPFTGYKFRTMVREADAMKASLVHLNEMQGPVFKIRRDPRVTRLGVLLRKFSIDELPQLWSVLLGDMSLVGPRPPSAMEFVGFSPPQRLKLAVRPGVTCVWQVSSKLRMVDFDEWMRLDRWYVENWSVALDAKLLLETVWVVVRGTGV